MGLPKKWGPPLGLAIRLALGAGLSANSWAAPIGAEPAVTSARSISHLDVGEADELSLVREKLIGEAIAKHLYQDPDYIDDPIISDVIAGIWSNLLQSARKQQLLSPEMAQTYDWHIFLGRDKSFNAFAVPGGYLGLHLGLVAATATPDELASVLAHELSHVIQRHISRGQTQNSRMAPLVMAALVLGAAAAKKSDGLAQASLVGGSAVGTQLQLNYSRDMEREADRIGFAIFKGAGYAPQGFVTMFEKLQSANRWSDDGSFPYLRTHPLNAERIAAMKVRLHNDDPPIPQALPISPLAYTLITARARAYSALPLEGLQTWATEIELPNFAQQPLEKRLNALVVGSRYYQLSGQSAKAQRLMLLLQQAVHADASAVRVANQMQVDLAVTQRDWTAASALLGVAPTTRADTHLLAQVHLGTGHAAKAIELLQLWLARYPEDVRAWQLLASAHETQGQALRQIRALAEAQLAQYDPEGALDRLKSALKRAPQFGPTDDTDIDLSIIQSRIKAIQAKLAASTL